MKYQKLTQIQKLFFGHEELARVLDIGLASAKVAASRYVRQGWLVRIKRNVYMLREKWKTVSLEELFQIANIGQVPSYISLTTALAFYGISTQIQRDFIESIALQRTREIHVNSTVFTYTRISKDLYFGFDRTQHYFMACPEKALLDAMYLMSFGRYSLDTSALDSSKLDLQNMTSLSNSFPSRTRKLLRSHGYLPEA